MSVQIDAGIPIDKVAKLNQGVRNHVGSELLNLTLRELFVFRFMQVKISFYWTLFHFPSSKLA